MPRLEIVPEEVEEIASNIGGQHIIIGEALESLRAIDAHLATVWEGPARQIFYETYGNWITQLENYSETLTNVQAYLRSVAQNFRDLDEAAQQAASGATMPE